MLPRASSLTLSERKHRLSKQETNVLPQTLLINSSVKHSARQRLDIDSCRSCQGNTISQNLELTLAAWELISTILPESFGEQAKIWLAAHWQVQGLYDHQPVAVLHSTQSCSSRWPLWRFHFHFRCKLKWSVTLPEAEMMNVLTGAQHTSKEVLQD